MKAELVLSVLQRPDAALGHVMGFAVTDQLIVALGGTSPRSSLVMASSDARHFARRAPPRDLGLRDVLAVGDSLWACGESGLLAVSRDQGGRWQLLETGTERGLCALAIGSDGALWVVGEAGYAARVLGDRPRPIDVGTVARLASVHAVRDEIVMLGGDGIVRRWRDGQTVAVACGATRPLKALAITPAGTWVVVGDGGFIARSPDGTGYRRVATRFDVDLEAIGVLPDGTLAIAGDRGQLLVSTDDARTWRGVANELGRVHLWSIERFGGGALIGGDGGLIVKLAPPDDVTWGDRVDVFGGAPPRGGAVAAGLEGGIANEAARRAERDAALARTPPGRWGELAWEWIDDGAAHRALLSRLDQTQRAQLAAIDALGDASDDERAVAVPRIAAALSAELEAVLVGSLVRGDQLEGVPIRPREAHGHAERARGDDAADPDEVPDLACIAAALAMTRRGLCLAPGDRDLQFTHAMLLIDAERAGDPRKAGELFVALSTFAPPVRIHVATRMGQMGHPRFGEAVELVLGEALPERGLGGRRRCAGGGAAIAFGGIPPELFGELGEAILAHAPGHITMLVPYLPDDPALLAELAQQALGAHERDAALALYDRLIALPIPGDRGERTIYLRALNNACVQAHAAQAFDAAVRIAERAQPVAHENPYLYHAAACAYAAVHDYVRAFEQVKLAVEHGYDDVAKIETDAELGPLLDWPALKVLFRDWHARREGN